MLWLSVAAAATLKVPEDYPTIQEAIDAAESGDFVEVYEGSYAEDLVVDIDIEIGADGGQVEIVGTHVVDEDLRISGIDFTGDGENPCFQVTAEAFEISMSKIIGCDGAIVATGTDLSLRGIAFSGNGAHNGPGVLDLVDGTLYLLDSEISGNGTTYGNAGAIEVTGDVEVDDCLFSGNSGYNGAGALQVTGDVLITESTFSGDTTTYGAGGALYAAGGTVLIEDSGFRSHSAHNGGGAIATRGADVELVGVTFEDTRTTYGHGGALDASGGNFVRLEDVVVDRASAQDNGGLIFANATSVEVLDSRFEGGQTTYGPGGGLALTATSVELTRIWIEGCDSGNYGGGLYSDADNTVLQNAVLMSNTASAGGGAWIAGDRAEVYNNDFLGNLANSAPDGAAMSTDYAEFVNNIVSGSSQTLPAIGTGSVLSEHNAWFDNNEAGSLTHEMDVMEDCEFVAFPDDLHLAEGSPCIDAGSPAVQDPDGSPSDIGAFGGPNAPWDGPIDTGLNEDSGDAGADTGLDGSGTDRGTGVRAFCGCGSSGAGVLVVALLALAGRRRRR